MAIDRIGKTQPPAVSPEAAKETTHAAQVDRPFEVPGTAPAAASTTSVAAKAPVEAPSGPLGQVQAGSLDVHGYVARKVEEATAHLAGMPDRDLVNLRAALRDRLVSDPTLVDLLRTATGGDAPPPVDE